MPIDPERSDARREHPLMPVPGQTFNRYRVVAFIGKGAFGSVYRAHDLRLDRAVALKLYHLDTDNDDRLRRFWREAELSRNLVHPHTVRVYDYGVEGGTVPFIALELLQGESLHQRLQHKGPFSVDETRRIAGCVLKCLMEAHAYGIVHRDIKPSNILLCRYAGENDYVKVLDFGIAKAPNRDLTAHGWLVGTPAYMAPEQILDENLSPRADLYALGLLMTTMLSGSAVYRGETSDILIAQCDREPVPLPRAVLESELGPVIRRATEKDPARRYQSAGEMLADLQGAVPLEPTWNSTLAQAGIVPDPEAPPASASSRGPWRGRSVAPVAYGVSDSVSPPPAQRIASGSDLKLVAAALFALISVCFACAALVLALAPKPHTLVPVLASHDPCASTAWIRLRAAHAGFALADERRISATTVDLEFEHPAMLGVIRVDTLASESDARWLEKQVEDDRGRATLRRGHRVLSVWAAPRGKTGFDKSTSESALARLCADQN